MRTASIARAYNNIRPVYSDKKDYNKALSFQNKFLRIKARLGNKIGEAIAYDNIAYIYAEPGKYVMVLNYYNKAFKIFEELNSKNKQLPPLQHMAEVYSKIDKPEKAKFLAKKALAIAQDMAITVNSKAIKYCLLRSNQLE